MSELSEDTRRLLAKGRAPVPIPVAQRARLKKMVVAKILAGSTLLLTSGASSAAVSSVLKTLAALGLGAGAGIVAVGVHETWVDTPAQVQQVRQPMDAPLSVAPKVVYSASVAASVALAPEPSVSTSAVAAPPRPTAMVTSTPQPAEVPVEAPAVASTLPPAPNVVPTSAAAPASARLQEEARLIRESEALIRSGNAALALRILDEHQARFPEGALSPERHIQRILALCALGRHEQAKGLALPILQKGPGPFSARLNASCVGTK